MEDMFYKHMLSYCVLYKLSRLYQFYWFSCVSLDFAVFSSFMYLSLTISYSFTYVEKNSKLLLIHSLGACLKKVVIRAFFFSCNLSENRLQSNFSLNLSAIQARNLCIMSAYFFSCLLRKAFKISFFTTQRTVSPRRLLVDHLW